MDKEKTTFFITLIVALIILVVATALSVKFSEDKGEIEYRLNRSIFNKRPSGYAAWHKTITEAEVNIKVWQNNYASLLIKDQKDATMILVSPEFIAGGRAVFTSNDIDKLLNWVRVGNTLIFVDDFRKASSRNFLEKLNLETTQTTKTTDKHDLLDRESTVYGEKKYNFNLNYFNITDTLKFKSKTISTSCKTRLKEKFLTALIEDDLGIALAKRNYGDGTIYISTMPDLAANDMLFEKEDNYQFFTNLALIEGNEVYINEYVHGMIKTDRVIDYYKDTLMSPLSKQIMILLLLLLWSASRRFGRVRPYHDPDRKSSLEYVEAMSNLYKQAGLTGTALIPVYNQFKLALCRELRIDTNLSDKDLFMAIRQNYSEPQASELIDLIATLNVTIKNDYISREDMVDFCMKLNVYRLKG